MHVLSSRTPDVFTAITNAIIAALEQGAGTCTMPWHGGLVAPPFPVNAATGKAYRGINVIALWVAAMAERYVSGQWASYRQWQGLGAQVRKGERGAVIVFYKSLDRPGLAIPEERDSVEETSFRFVAKATHVFNAEQVEGWQPPLPEAKSPVAINEEVAAFLEAVGAEVRHGFPMALYRRSGDYIEMPSPGQFIGTATSTPTEAYHAVLLHELTHWSGAGHRLNRVFGQRFGDQSYAFEELVAEFGAAFLCSAFRLTNEPRPDHAAYIASWLAILRKDSKAVFTAASKAQEAVQFLIALATTKTIA